MIYTTPVSSQADPAQTSPDRRGQMVVAALSLLLAWCAGLAVAQDAPADAAKPKPATAPDPLERNWSVLGKPLFKAVYRGLDDQTVRVQPTEGEPIDIPFADLTPSDQEWVLRYEDGPAPRRMPPEWEPGYKVRFPVRVTGDLLKSEAHTVIVSVPTGGWLKPDVSDILVTDQNGDLVPLVVLSHDPLGDTLIQFRRRGFDRWYFVYACNPKAPDKDKELAQKLETMKSQAEQAQLDKMALFKDAAQKAATFRDLSAAVELQKKTLAGAVAELEGWAKTLPEREATLKAANEKVPVTQAALTAAETAHAPFQKVAEAKTTAANELTRVANEAKRAADAAAAARDAATKAVTETAAAAQAAVEALELAVRAHQSATAELSTRQTAATTAAADAAAAKQQVDAAAQAVATAQADLAAAKKALDAAGDDATEPLKLAVTLKQQALTAAQSQQAQAVAAYTPKAAASQGAAKKLEAGKAALAAAASAQQAAEAKRTSTAEAAAAAPAAVPPLEAKAKELAADAAAKEIPAAAAREAASAARLAAAPTETALKAAQAAHRQATSAAAAALKAVEEAKARIAEVTKIKENAEKALAELTPRYEPAKLAAEKAKTASEQAVADATRLEKEYFDFAHDVDPRLYKEGLSVEFREWSGDELSSWAAVAGGLAKSENVLGSAVVHQVLQNVNPFRRSDPRNFAASYRGFIRIDEPGIYSFFANGDDATFVFINGYRVYSRTGTNEPIGGKVALYSVGADIQLDAGVHPIEVHQVVGNTPRATGVLGLLWLTPTSKNWGWVPREQFPQAMLAIPTPPITPDGSQAAVFEFGVEESLAADGLSMFIARFQPSGVITSPDALTWDYGDGTTASGAQPYHLYFGDGDFIVSLKSSPDLPPFKRRCHMWIPPVSTSPLSLGLAVDVLRQTDITQLDLPRLSSAFQFLRISHQDDRWPVVQRVCEQLLTHKELDLKYRAMVYEALMQALAEQGQADKAIKLLDAALHDVGHIRTLRAMVQLAEANVIRNYIRDYAEAEQRYEALLQEHRRLRHPVVRQIAIAWADMYADAGNSARAAETYRLAKDLGTIGLGAAGADDPVKRGALLRVAEQQLQEGNITQTGRLLERIEQEFPEQKLEGLYRFLHGEAQRQAGWYDQAIRDYEALLQLRQWASYAPHAMYGVADSYYRMGDLVQAWQWLSSVRDTYPAFFRQRSLDAYASEIEARLTAANAAAGEGAPALPAPFDRFVTDFEPQSPLPGKLPQTLRRAPSLGIDGAATVMLDTGVKAHDTIPTIELKNIPSQGSLWVELWYRNRGAISTRGGHRAFGITVTDDQGRTVDSATLYPDPTYGQWQKLAWNFPRPASADGAVSINLVQSLGIVEIDRLRVVHVTDRQNSALTAFINGADPQ